MYAHVDGPIVKSGRDDDHEMKNFMVAKDSGPWVRLAACICPGAHSVWNAPT